MDSFPKNLCMGCLGAHGSSKLSYYFAQSSLLLTQFQNQALRLCVICAALAIKCDEFILNVSMIKEKFSSHRNMDSDECKWDMNNLKAKLKTRDFRAVSQTNEYTEPNSELMQSAGSDFQKAQTLNLHIKEEVNVDFERDAGCYYSVDSTLSDDPANSKNMEVKAEVEDIIGDASTKQDVQTVIPAHQEIEDYAIPQNSSLAEPEGTHLDEEDPVDNVQTITITPTLLVEQRAMIIRTLSFRNAPYKCQECLLDFKMEEAYRAHMVRHSEEYGFYICDICEQRTETLEQMEAHNGEHFKRYRCTECSYLRLNRDLVVKHHREEHLNLDVTHDHVTTEVYSGEVYDCQMCPKIINSRRGLIRHMNFNHKGKGRKICDECDKTFYSSSALKNHIKIRHSTEPRVKSFGCPECASSFYDASTLKMHMAIHTKKRDFHCSDCDKSFKTERSLVTHMRTSRKHRNGSELTDG